MPGRAGFSSQVRREFWRLIAAGEQTVAEARGRWECRGLSRSVVQPSWRHDADRTPRPIRGYLSITEREEIAVLNGHVSVREIERRLAGVDPLSWTPCRLAAMVLGITSWGVA